MQRGEPHRQSSPGSRCRRPCACRLHLDAAGNESRLQEPGRDAHGGWRAGIDRSAVGRRERHRVWRAACNAINPARLDRSREPRRPRVLSVVAGTRSEFLSRFRSVRNGCIGRVAGPESGARPALSPAGLPQPCPSWRHDFGVRADEPRRGFQVRADRPGLERAGKNLLDPLHRARLSRRLPCERSLQAGHLPSRGDPELHR